MSFNFFISREKNAEGEKYLYLNITSHPINLVNKKPGSISKEEYEKYKEKSITLNNFHTLNLIEENKEINDNEMTYIIKNFKIEESAIDELINKMEELFINNEINIGIYKNIIIFVSLPILQNFKNKLENKLNQYFDINNVKIVGVINATARGVYPPIACLKYFGYME